MEILTLHLHPIGGLGGTEQPELGLDMQQEHEIGEEPLGRPHVQRQDVLLPQTSRPPLVRERRVHVAVADHCLPLREGRPDDRGHGLCPARSEQERLRPSVQLARVRIEQ